MNSNTHQLQFVTALLVFSAHFVSGQINSTGYPDDFLWGTATAAYQVEGAFDTDGRGASIWDIFSHVDGNTFNGDNGDVADDFYHRFRDDIQIMSQLGIDSFRLSLSWSRILPDGRGTVNQKGIDFYNEVIDELLANDITPAVTLYHWDLPNRLQREYGGWLDRDQIKRDFVEYARVAFENFGDRVKFWITFNEPNVFIGNGYGSGEFAPGLVTDQAAFVIPATLVLTHAEAVDLYRKEFQPTQQGEIGITLNSDWCEPLTQTRPDIAACDRQMLSNLAIYSDPIFFGDYSDDMKAFLPNLEVFTPQEKRLLRGSHDFFGLNHYSTRFGSNDRTCDSTQATCAILSAFDKDGVPIGAQSASDFLIVVPFGFRRLLNYIQDRYDNPPIYVTENGFSDPDLPLDRVNEVIPPLLDTGRIEQIIDYLEQMRLAIVEDKVDVRGYYHWSLLDNFEWAEGYSKRFGLVYVDIKGDLSRHPKESFSYYKDFIIAAKKNSVPRNLEDSAAGLVDAESTQGIVVVGLVAAAVIVILSALIFLQRRKQKKLLKTQNESQIGMNERLVEEPEA